jgi:hypothetical protein
MTGWVGEHKRAALASVPAAGVSALMPPHSQGAEKRVERRRRWALRALVVGGLAGAAWLLTGAAAQAADHEETAGGSSLLSSVVRGDATPVVGDILKAAAQPLDAVRPQNQQHQRNEDEGVLARPVAILTGNGKTGAHTALGAVDGVVRELTGPLRLTGGPEDSRRLAPVAAPLTRTLRGVAGTLPQAATPDRTQRPASAVTPVTRAVAATRTADLVTAPHPKAAGPAGHRQVHAKTAPAGKRHSIVTEGHPVAATAARPDTLGNTTPGGDGPAPLQVHLGALSGISTSASGAPTEGGSAAFLPAAVASGLVAYHRLRTATDVEVRRFDAETPTVSPD